jgi:hypothetical protein
MTTFAEVQQFQCVMREVQIAFQNWTHEPDLENIRKKTNKRVCDKGSY